MSYILEWLFHVRKNRSCRKSRHFGARGILIWILVLTLFCDFVNIGELSGGLGFVICTMEAKSPLLQSVRKNSYDRCEKCFTPSVIFFSSLLSFRWAIYAVQYSLPGAYFYLCLDQSTSLALCLLSPVFLSTKSCCHFQWMKLCYFKLSARWATVWICQLGYGPCSM